MSQSKSTKQQGTDKWAGEANGGSAILRVVSFQRFSIVIAYHSAAERIHKQSLDTISWAQQHLRRLLRQQTTLAAHIFDNRYLNQHDSAFVDIVIEDLTDFLDKATVNRIFLFPPVESHYRFLIHKTVEDFPTLASFSIGEGEGRQTVVCLVSTLNRTPKGQAMLMSSPQSQPREPRGRGRGRQGVNDSPSLSRPGMASASRDDPGRLDSRPQDVSGNSHSQSSDKQPPPRLAGRGRARPRKPEMQLYVPRGRRQAEAQQLKPDNDQQSVSQGTSHTCELQSRFADRVTLNETQDIQDVENSQQLRAEHAKSKKVNKSLKNDTKQGGDISGASASSKRKPEVQRYVPRARRKAEEGEPSSDTINNKHPAHKKRGDSRSQKVKPSEDASGCPSQHALGDQMDVTETGRDLGLELRAGKGTEDLASVPPREEWVAESAGQPEVEIWTTDALPPHTESEMLPTFDSAVFRDVPGKLAEGNLDHDRLADPSSDLSFKQSISAQEAKQEFEEELWCTEPIKYGSASNIDLSCVRGENESLPVSSDGFTCDTERRVSELESEELQGSQCTESQSSDSCGGSMTDISGSLKVEEMVICSTEKESSTEHFGNAQLPGQEQPSQEQQLSSLTQQVRSELSTSPCVSEQSSADSASFDNLGLVSEVEPSPKTHADNLTSVDVTACPAHAYHISDPHAKSECLIEKMEVQTDAYAEDKPRVQSPGIPSVDGICESQSSVTNLLPNQQVDELGDSCDKHENSAEPKDLSHVLPQSEENLVTDNSALGDSGDAALCESKVRGQGDDTAVVVEQAVGSSGEDKTDNSTEEDDDEDSWDKIFDDNGDCLDPTMMAELTAHVGEVKISKPKKINYLDYQPREADMDLAAYSHVIEISDFPAEFQTRDLLVAFKDYMSRGFDIKWVDDTHALGVFSSTIAAQDALKLIHPMMKLRPLSEASKQSRSKARRCQEFLQPYKARPETTAAAARRLVAGALGMTSRIPKEQRDQERRQLKAAKEKKKLDRKQKEAIWDGTFGKCAMDG
ncbi:hypothetical protein BaRGS_00032283 [Batillaria attramentaria]|uniref:R3H domain-containing protein n=1 Tax=Batillaria attramentaria TaxID=370345 RepID=A0ABD0JNT3_9CAEN